VLAIRCHLPAVCRCIHTGDIKHAASVIGKVCPGFIINSETFLSHPAPRDSVRFEVEHKIVTELLYFTGVSLLMDLACLAQYGETHAYIKFAYS
jgi:hypothetical protein